MNKGFICIILSFLLIGAISSSSAKDRIGTFDSRIIFMWYFNTPEFQKELKDMRAGYDKAKEKNDTGAIKEFETKGPLTQRVMHDKVFGRGTVAEYLEPQKEILAQIAKSEKLIAIVSKWELNYSSDDVELVDITMKLLEALKAPDNVKKMYDEMKNQQPIKDAIYIND